MKYVKNTLKALIILAVFVVSVNGQDFEGKVAYKMKSAGQEMNMTYLLKGDLVRIDVSVAQMGNTSSMIFSENKMIVIMPQQKMFMEMPMDMAKDMIEDKESLKEEKLPDGIEKTNEKKNILGYDCIKVIFHDEESDAVMWLAEGLGNFMPMQNPMNPKKNIWEEFLGGTEFFPLEITANSKEGKFSMKATEISKSKLPNDAFEIPSGYKKMDMGLGR